MPVYNKRHSFHSGNLYIPSILRILGSMNGAIDTLRLRLPVCEISHNADLRIQPGTRNLRTNEIEGEFTLYRKAPGNEITGNKAYCNTDLFQFDISQKGTYVKFSVPLVYNNGLNNILPPTNKNEFRSVMERVEFEMAERGIKTNINSGILSRVDLFKMIESDYEYSNYGIVYSSLNPTRKAKREYGYTSHFWKNTQGEILIYDKFQESLDKHKETFNLPQNSHRHEIRFTTGKSAKTNLKLITAGELVNEYECLTGHTARQLANIFTLKPSEFKSGLTEDIRNNLRQYKLRGGNALNSFCNDVGKLNLIKTLGPDSWISIVKDEFTKGTASKEKKKIGKLLLEHNIMTNNAIDLYTEIRGKAIDPNYEFSLVA